MSNSIRSMKTILLIALLSSLLLSVEAFAQGGIRGTVRDSSNAVITTATLTATNVETNIATTVTTNNSGIYSFVNIPSGTYNLETKAPGFATVTQRGLRIRLDVYAHDVQMKPSANVDEVDVRSDAFTALLESGASTGTALQEEMILSLPILSGNVMDLVNLMGGVVGPRPDQNPLMDAYETTFAGVPASGVNIIRDGITVTEPRYRSGISTPMRMNTEMLGELKMILSPVDAEYGYGTGQIVMTSRSGANAFHGSGVWNAQNTALDSLEWEIKARGEQNIPDWRNLHNYTLTFNGPIIRDKAFFFVMWDQQLSKTRAWAQVPVLTGCARQGIYRYLEDVSSSRVGNYAVTAPGYRGFTLNPQVVTNDGRYASGLVWGLSRPAVWYNDPAHKDGEPRLQWEWPSNTPSVDVKNSDTQNYVEWVRYGLGEIGGDA